MVFRSPRKGLVFLLKCRCLRLGQPVDGPSGREVGSTFSSFLPSCWWCPIVIFVFLSGGAWRWVTCRSMVRRAHAWRPDIGAQRLCHNVGRSLRSTFLWSTLLRLRLVAVVTVVRCTLESRVSRRLSRSGPCHGHVRKETDCLAPSLCAGGHEYAEATVSVRGCTC